MKRLSSLPAFFTAFFLLAATAVALRVAVTVRPRPLDRPLQDFPERIGDFVKVSSQTFSDKVVKVAGMDEYIMWQYRNGQALVGLYIGYYRDQVEGGIIHSPKHCMPGSGWVPTEVGEVTVRDAGGHEYRVNRMIMKKDGMSQVVHYWNQGRGRVVANEYLDRGWMIYDSLVLHRSDGALVRLTTEGDVAAGIRAQEAFMRDLFPVLATFLPGR